MHQHKVSPLSLSSFPPIPNLGHVSYSETPVNSGLGGLLTSSLTPALLFCLHEAEVAWEINSSKQLGKLFSSVGIKLTTILADPKIKPSRKQ